MLFGTGAIKDQTAYEPYLVLIPGCSSLLSCLCDQDTAATEGVALLVTQTKATSELTVDGQALGAKLTRVAVPGSGFSTVDVDLGTDDKIHTAKAPRVMGCSPSGRPRLWVMYGTGAACVQSE